MTLGAEEECHGEEVVGLLRKGADEEEYNEEEAEGLLQKEDHKDDGYSDDEEGNSDASAWPKGHARIIFFMTLILAICSFRSEYSRSPSDIMALPDRKPVLETWNAIWDKVDLKPIHGRKQLDIKIKSGAAPAKHENLEVMKKLEEVENVTTFSAQEIFDIFPNPWHPDTVQIYNKKAYHELIESFVLHENKFTIVANGGSSSAGGGNVEYENRFFTKLESFLRSLDAFGGSPSEVVNRAHGTRHSLHSAIFAPNFFPPHTDLVLWEFAINDYPYSSAISEETQAAQTRQMFLGWLREMERMEPRPPKVILIYLWKTPFKLNGKGKVNNPVFDFHADIAKEFDFVVGHVSLASYIDNELKEMDYWGAKRLFLADAHHPSHAGHLAMTFLLMVLLRGQGEWNNFPDATENSAKEDDHAVEKYEWFCGEETKDEIFIRNRILQQNGNSYSGWRSPLGTMTMEQPRNDEVISGPRQLLVGSTTDIVILGKQDPIRQDRQGSIPMPCCSGEPGLFTTVQVPIKTQPMNGANALFLAFGKRLSNIDDFKVFINSKDEAVPGRLIRVPGSWPCFWSFQDVYETWWYAFSEEQSDVSFMSMCVDSPTCSVNGRSGAHLIAMAVY